MYTAAAARSLPAELDGCGGVTSRARLAELGLDSRSVAAQVRARRWRVYDHAVLLSNADPTAWQRRRICLANCAPRALLTSFTATQEWGLAHWERKEIHVIAPAGSRRPNIQGLVLHRTADWSRVDGDQVRRLHDVAQALVLAAASFGKSRPATGIIAAGVQQGLVRPDRLREALELSPRVRHRRALLLALDDIAQGAQALSEIDLGKLCRRYRLPAPRRQAIRVEPSGRRRYLDAEWDLPGGGTLAVEVDGAHHLDVGTWNADQLRQNEVVLGGSIVLRYPSAMIRHEPEVVADQLRRALLRS